jgi:DNA-binding transcriptional MerR regulator
MADGRRMTIGQVARQTGLSPRAVRFYEAEGVLRPVGRSSSGYRLYADYELDLVRLVAQLRRVGLSVADVREVVRMRESGISPPDRIIALLEARVAGLDRNLELLQEARGSLVEVLHQARFGLEHGADVRLCRLVGARPISSHRASGTRAPGPNRATPDG